MCHASEQEPKHFPFLKKTRLAFNNEEKLVNIMMKDYLKMIKQIIFLVYFFIFFPCVIL